MNPRHSSILLLGALLVLMVFSTSILKGQETLVVQVSPVLLEDSLITRGVIPVSCSFKLISKDATVWVTERIPFNETGRYEIDVPFKIGEVSVLPTFYYQTSDKIGFEEPTIRRISSLIILVPVKFKSYPSEQSFRVVNYYDWERLLKRKNINLPGPTEKAVLEELLNEIKIDFSERTESEHSFMEKAFMGICILKKEDGEKTNPIIIYSKFIPNSLRNDPNGNLVVFMQ